jgi:ABC-type Mn2+/Zn2+ transport system permease subunit
LGLITSSSCPLNSQVLILLGISAGTAAAAAAVDASKNIAAPPSANLLHDLISDQNGIQLDRFQMVVWTLVMGCVFLYYVFHELTMPLFDSTLLTLMGISAGTYVTLKVP